MTIDRFRARQRRSGAVRASVLFVLLVTAAYAADATVSPKAIQAEIDRIAATRSLWPGFDPRTIPVAIFDGEHTCLLRHPHPPREFHQEKGIWVMEGRYPGLVANNALDVAGVQTAGVLLDQQVPRSVDQQAALVIHEAFHVYQRAHHPGWTANEADLFTYPLDDADALAKRRLETLALRHALDSPAPAATCWVKLAMSERQQRYAELGAAAMGYERGNEMNEGLAQYIQSQAEGSVPRLPAEDFPAAQVRQRLYATGGVIAVLLDRLYPGWKRELDARDTTPLDTMLAATVASAPAGCGFTSEEVAVALDRARREVAGLEEARRQAKTDFLAQPGWKLVLEAGTAPLMLQGFDPVNVTNLGNLEILHTRMLKLGNGSGSIEVIDHTSLTEAVGPHPLFNGVREVTVGLSEQPKVTIADGVITVEAGGLQAHFQNAEVLPGAPQTVRLRISPPPK